MKKFALILMVLFVTAGAYAHDSDRDHYGVGNVYQSGYIAGFRHGTEDMRAGVNFDYRHDYEYRQAAGQHFTYDTHQACDWRVGYIEGYVDGFFRRSSQYPSDYDQDGDHDGDYDHDGDNDGGYDHNGPPGPALGLVTVFTDRYFRGSSRNFGIGRYPHLEGTFNDNIDGLQINGNVRVILFDGSNFSGRYIVVDRSTADLGWFNNQAASMIIEPYGDRRY